MASFAISWESRKPPSVTTPATPRFIRRDTRMAPAEAARVLAAVDDHDGAGRAFLDRLALRMGAVLEYRDRVEVLARRDSAQRIGLAGMGPARIYFKNS